MTVTWARNNVSGKQAVMSVALLDWIPVHWSRVYEYPWAVSQCGRFKGWFLDAGGGGAVLQHIMAARGMTVVNVDMLHDTTIVNQDILKVTGDIGKLPFIASSFDIVACISVLEHTCKPVEIVRELWRVVMPGGRLIVTLDVTERVSTANSIDISVAADIVGEFGMIVPDEPPDILIDNIDGVLMKVLCFNADKPE